MILLIDNYDSFSYNLYQLLGELDGDIEVVTNDQYTVEQLAAKRPSAVVISPGPGRPCDAGIIEQAAIAFTGKCPVLGVCLGHQAICEAFGGTITYAKRLMHGKRDTACLKDCPLFDGLPATISAARYHSLAADRATLPTCLTVTAETADGEIMAVKHTQYETYGLQFHPESILTEHGKDILFNFLKRRKNI